MSEYTVNKTTSNIPEHIAIIMDGNGRWAKKRSLVRISGHKKGAENVVRIVECCGSLGVKYLTLYTFSVENWKRPEKEVTGLMDLFEKVLAKKMPGLIKNNVRLNIIGDLSKVRESTKRKFREATEKTNENDGLVLTIALNYSSRDEIVRAANKAIAAGEKQLDEDTFSKYLDTAGMPDPQLLIRTSGEMRISNFLLWQIAYTELFVTDTLWPDFSENDISEAIAEFQRRERRFGGI